MFEGELSHVHQYVTNRPPNTFGKRVWGQPVIPTDQLEGEAGWREQGPKAPLPHLPLTCALLGWGYSESQAFGGWGR